MTKTRQSDFSEYVDLRSEVAATVAETNERIVQYGIGSRAVLEMVGSNPTKLDQSSRLWRAFRLFVLGKEVIRQRVSEPVTVDARWSRTDSTVAHDELTITETKRTVPDASRAFRLATSTSYIIDRRVNVHDGRPTTTVEAGWIADGMLQSANRYDAPDNLDLQNRVEQVAEYGRALEELQTALATR